MIFVISPAKALDFKTPAATSLHSQPAFLAEAAELIDLLRRLTPGEVAALMKLSDPLAALNVARYANWSTPFSLQNAKQAVLAFDGDVYDGLDAKTLSDDDLQWAQRHLRILSGLYGVLRPLDLMQPYRLEMAARLENARGKNLYMFWQDKPAGALSKLLAKEREAGREAVLVNLASEEYFKAVRLHEPSFRIVRPVFEDWKAGRYRIVSFYAKRARGLMSRYAITHRAETVEQLKEFSAEGYAFDASASDENILMFRRRD